MNELQEFKQVNTSPLMLAYYAFALVMLSGFVYFYQFTPLEETWNNLVINGAVAFVALVISAIASAIYLHYQPEDHPRKIWGNMLAACWTWFIAETLWAALAYFLGDVPTPSLADAGWVLGFVFFTVAFYQQYAAIFPAKKRQILQVALSAWAVAIFLPLIFLLVTNSFTLEAYVNYYYPIADLAVGIAGIALVFVFQGGALMRPWVGLLVFTVSDLFYAWAEQAGIYEWSSVNSNALTIAIDSSYLAAYLVLGMGFLSHWALINYGIHAKK